MAIKNKVRQQLLIIRKELSEKTKKEASRIICDKIRQLSLMQEADVLYLYIAKNPELSLQPLLQWALTEGKRVAVPRVQGDTMDFYELTDERQLQSGAFGILEPDNTCKLLQESHGLCLVPGVGFDKSGHRIGYGKGYYDKYFDMYPGIVRIGIAYDEQVMEAIPSDEHDQQMHMVVTPNNIYKM